MRDSKEITIKDNGTEYTYKYAKKRKLRIIEIIDRIPEQTNQLSFL